MDRTQTKAAQMRWAHLRAHMVRLLRRCARHTVLLAVLLLAATTAAAYGADAAADHMGFALPDQAPQADAPVQKAPARLIPTALAGCYSDEATVMHYLQVPAPPQTHELIAELEKKETLALYRASAVSMATSGREKIAEWKAVNSDVIGWLKVSGTNIDYPVVQGPYTDYYTTRGYYKETSHNGVIWLSSASSVGSASQLSPNSVIYGHNWTNCSAYPKVGSPSDVMFAQLTAFQHLWFAQENQYIYFSTGSEEMVWQIFAAFYTDTGFAYNTASPGDLQWIIDGARDRSEHDYSVSVSSSDKILTLSTCARRFDPYDDRQRFVVMAKLVDRIGSGSTVTSNPDPRRPDLS